MSPSARTFAGGRVVDLAGDVRERAVGRGEPVLERGLIDTDDRGEHRRVPGGVLDQARVGGDGGLRHRHREVDPVAVEDGPARCRELDRLQALTLTE